MAFPSGFLEELRDRLPLSEVVGRRVKLTRKGRELSGLCPFHSEKTPSFWVNDEKGVFHCFGCAASGDGVEFVMRTEGLSFPEAVERLAGLAGMEVPHTSPEERACEERRKTLVDATEAACQWFEKQLRTEAAQRAVAYLKARGLDGKTAARFRLGYAPDARAALRAAMNAAGFADALLAEAGLIGIPEDGGVPYDRFRDRIVFPIADARGRIIAFGGRALADHQGAKYLNSPETPLFNKSRVLYGLPFARAAAQEKGEIVVVEGYMDAIALHQAGIAHAVAPLGTAVTEEHIEALWRLAAEPILCLDGDSAGMRAAARAAERAIPILRPGFSLRFATLPEGEDPDSLVRKPGAEGGPAAFARILAAARPMVEEIWRGETEGRVFDTPERRAGLEARLEALANRIRDGRVRGHYRTVLRDKLRAMMAPHGGQASRAQQSGPGSRPGSGWASPQFRDSAWRSKGLGYPTGRAGKPSAFERLAGVQARFDAQNMLERLLLAAPILHSKILGQVAEDLGSISFFDRLLDSLRAEVLHLAAIPDIESVAIERHLRDCGLDRILDAVLARDLHLRASFARPDAPEDEVVAGWRRAYALYTAGRAGDEAAADERELGADMTDETWARFQARQADRMTVVEHATGIVEQVADEHSAGEAATGGAPHSDESNR